MILHEGNPSKHPSVLPGSFMILQRLREATRSAHERLEAHVGLTGQEWSLTSYQRLLQKFYGFYHVIEPAMLQHPQWQELGLDIEQRRKLPLLERDLKHLGLSEPSIAALAESPQAPRPTQFASALGCAYVLEGSTLGGQLITRHFSRELGLTPECGLTFFASYGANVGPMWREFVAALDSYPASAEELSQIIDSACGTFGGLEAWLGDLNSPLDFS